MTKTNLQSAIGNRQLFISAWLFDVYPSEHGVTLWFIDHNGNRLHFSRQFTPYFFLHLNASDTKRAVALGAMSDFRLIYSDNTNGDLLR